MEAVRLLIQLVLFFRTNSFNLVKLNEQNRNSFAGCSIIQMEVDSKGGVTMSRPTEGSEVQTK